jgi:hypothetical protein
MVYRGAEFAVAQDVGTGTWRWKVNLNEHTVESGQRNSREAALSAVVMTVDRWVMRTAKSAKAQAGRSPDVVNAHSPV